MIAVGIQLNSGAGPVDDASAHLGTVLPGTSSTDLLFDVVNTGDTDLPAPVAWVEQASLLDGEFQVTIAGVPVTGDSAETATVLPPLAVGASHAGVARCVNPAGDVERPMVDRATVRVAPTA